jgi:hypothetical protein
MVLNYKEEFSPRKMVPTWRGLGRRMLQPFNPLMTFAILFCYLIGEGIMFLHAISTEDVHKICFAGHGFGLISGVIVGIIVLDNKVTEYWEKILKRALVVFYIITFFTMLVMNFSFITERNGGEEISRNQTNHGLPNPCRNCWKSFWNESALTSNGACTIL